MGITRFGNRQLSKALDRWGDNIIADVKRIVVETAELLKTEAVARAPHDTGDLKRSIEVTVLADGLTAIVTVGAHYAIYIEFGTGIYAVKGNGRKTPWGYLDPKGRLDENGQPLWIWTKGMHAQPFWFPAVDIARDYFKNEMRKLGR
ncbi:HK97-gp10 family putative phage morphogenesis protein [Solibacillus sp. FSL R7-0668]|uniref:HK97-gp10 family putative phage morphogenesis protein n=1 Tax=Solibacillus sp. FSL R7-0668 TaxID=2921688 RepID=UPI0030FA33FE